MEGCTSKIEATQTARERFLEPIPIRHGSTHSSLQGITNSIVKLLGRMTNVADRAGAENKRNLGEGETLGCVFILLAPKENFTFATRPPKTSSQ